MPTQASRLVNDISYLPAILGRMGLSIAEAQDELNQGYVQAVAELVKLLGGIPKAPEKDPADKTTTPPSIDPQIATLLLQLAPSRYQFSETTFDFNADLAESFSAAASGALRLGTKAVALNAAMSVGFGYDYRAAARISYDFPHWTVRAEAVADSPAWAIIKRAEAWPAHLVVLGAHGHSALSRFVLGSVSQKALTEVRCSVRIARASRISWASLLAASNMAPGGVSAGTKAAAVSSRQPARSPSSCARWARSGTI